MIINTCLMTVKIRLHEKIKILPSAKMNLREICQICHVKTNTREKFLHEVNLLKAKRRMSSKLKFA